MGKTKKKLGGSDRSKSDSSDSASSRTKRDNLEETETELVQDEEPEETLIEPVKPIRERTKRHKPEQELITKLGVWSCKDIRTHLENTPLSAEEKVAFIDQNLNSSKGLRSYISKQHYGLKDLKFMSEAGRDLKKIMGAKAEELWGMMYDESESDNDPDCVYLKELKKKFYEEKEKESNKSRWGRFMTASKNIVKATGNVALEGLKFAGKWGMEGLKILSNGGFRLWAWITSNPKTAYFTLVLLKQLKTELCRSVGSWYVTKNVNLNDKESIIKFIHKLNPDMIIEPHTTLGDLKSILKDLSKPFIGQVIGQSSASIFKGLGKKLGPTVGAALGGAALLIPGVGPFISSGVNVVCTSVFDSMAEAGAEMAEQAMFISQARNCFTMLKELINPVQCLDDTGKEAMSILQPRLDEAEKQEKKAKQKEAEEKKLEAKRLEAEQKRLEAEKNPPVKKGWWGGTKRQWKQKRTCYTR